MGIVVDVIAGPAAHVVGIAQVQEAENETGDAKGNRKDVDAANRLKQDAGENDGRYPARCPQATVVWVLAVPEVGRDIGNNDAA